MTPHGEAALVVELAIDRQQFGRRSMPFVHTGHPAGVVTALGVPEGPDTVGVSEARGHFHEGELENRDYVVLDKDAGGLAGRVFQDLDAFRRRGLPCDPGPAERQAVGRGEDGRLVPVPPDPPDIDGMGRRGRVQVLARWHALFPETIRHVEVERRPAYGHSDDPLAGGPGLGQPADHGLDVGDGPAGRQRRVEELEALTVHVSVGVHQPGNDRRAPEVHHARPRAAPASELPSRTDRQDPLAGDRQGLGAGRAPIQREDAAVGEDPVSGYLSHPFSR